MAIPSAHNMEINKKHLIAYSILGVLVALFFGITMHQCSNPKVKYITSPPERIHDTIIRDSIQIQERVVTKYVTKDMTNTIKKLGAKSYYCSRGLKKAVEIKRGRLRGDFLFQFENDYIKTSTFDIDDNVSLSVLTDSIG